MIDGVKIADWDFIFTPDDPVCEMKLNNLIDLYFENAEKKKYSSFNVFDILEAYKDINYLKTYVRRKDICDATWIINLPSLSGYKKNFPVGNSAISRILKRDAIIEQYHRFVEMIETLDIMKDLEEVFDNEENGKFRNLMSYYVFRMFLNIYSNQLDRTITGAIKNHLGDVYGIHIDNSTKLVVRELLAENEEKRILGIYER